MSGAHSETGAFKTPAPRRWSTPLAALCVALATFFFATVSANRLAPTWDEGDAFSRAERVGAWLDAFLWGPAALRTDVFESESPTTDLREGPRLALAEASSRRELFSARNIEIGFPHAIYVEGHPSGYTLTIAIGARIARAVGVDSWFSEKVAYRFGGICLLTLAAVAVFLRTSRSFGLSAGVAAVVGTLSCPHVFGHALIGGGDSLLISSWLLAWSLFPSAERRTRNALFWGLALGLSFSAKFSGFLLAAPFAVVFIAQALIARLKAPDFIRTGARLLLGVAVGLGFFMLVNPPLWSDPLQGIETFWTLNVSRPDFNIPAYFFGKFYDVRHPLPWWNGFFWLVATVPVFLTVSALAPLVWAALWRTRRASERQTGGDSRRLLVFSALAVATTLPITRAFPGVPVHDGVRLLVASSSFLGLLGGLGAALFARRIWSDARCGRLAKFFRFATTVALLAPSVADLILVAPQYLSFYSAAVGGLAGATKLGLDPTYYWDAFDAEVAARLRALTEKARAEGRPSGVLFSSFSSVTLYYEKRWNTFATPDVATISDPTVFSRLDEFGFYVSQRRPSVISPFDIAVAKNARLVFVKTARDPLPNPFYPNCENVSVLEVYDMRGKGSGE